MKINLTPQRRDATLEVVKAGDALTLNGVTFDFTALPDGATMPAGAIGSDWFAGPVERIAGELHVTLVLPHGAAPSHAVCFPQPLENVPDGPVEFPT